MALKARSNRYSYDAVYEAGSSQESVFADVEPIVTSVMDGYNVCIFAYGQTGMQQTLGGQSGRLALPGYIPNTVGRRVLQVSSCQASAAKW